MCGGGGREPSVSIATSGRWSSSRSAARRRRAISGAAGRRRSSPDGDLQGRRLQAGAVPPLLGEVGRHGHPHESLGGLVRRAREAQLCLGSFLKHHLGAAAPENPEVEALRLEVAEMKEKYEAVLEENKKLKAKLAALETPQEEKRE